MGQRHTFRASCDALEGRQLLTALPGVTLNERINAYVYLMNHKGDPLPSNRLVQYLDNLDSATPAGTLPPAPTPTPASAPSAVSPQVARAWASWHA